MELIKLLSSQKIDDILSKADIVSITSAYLNLTKKGRNYLAVCPFHNDSNPSFTISPEKKRYKCFSCGVSGNVINFVKEFEQIDFLSAVKKVCQLANIELDELKDYSKNKKDPEIESILELNNKANEIFKVTLFSSLGKQALNYLNQRKISVEEIKKFEIGFASKKTNLVEKLLAQNYSALAIEKAGLGVIEKDYTKDYFSDRIIFPIKDENNQIIGFSARSYQQAQEPKYLNSRENKLFKKAQLAYNINQALKASRASRQIIVLEGFVDVISLSKININNAIAIMGTSLSQYHIDLFKKHKLDVLLFLDGDQAGVNASLKVSQELLKAKITTYIVNNQTIKDPDELINQNQVDYLKTIIANPIHPIDYAIDKLWQTTNQNDPVKVEEFIKKICRFSLATDSVVLKEMTINKLALKTKLSTQTINKLWPRTFLENNKQNQQKFKKDIIIDKKQKQHYDQTDQYKEFLKAEQRIFVSLLQSDQYLDKINFKVDKMIHSDIKYATISLIKLYNSNMYKGHDARQAIELLKEYNILNFNEKQEEIINDPIQMQLVTAQELDDIFVKLDNFHLLMQIKELRQELNKAKTTQEKDKIYKAIIKLSNNK
ncbi:DNA primase [Mycoplasma putrefaciens]|uniref:DNA primase n=1 Tax=Mycoplasma putrefaciens TaxID=2123 RepID=UPI003DA34209